MRKSIRLGLLIGVLAFGTSTASLVPARDAHAQGFEYSPDLGVLVQHVNAGMLVRAMRRAAFARQLGLQPGDLIFAINGQHPDSLSDIHNMLFTGADDEDHDLDVLRGGQHLHAAVFHHGGEILVHGSLH